MDPNFTISIDKITETRVAVSVSFLPTSLAQNDLSHVDIRFRDLVQQFANLYTINPKVKMSVLADTSGSMTSRIPPIEEVAFMEHAFRLPLELGSKREGAQIYTLAILGVIIKKVVAILHENNIPIDLEYEIVPFGCDVKEVLSLNVFECDEIGQKIIDHMQKCHAGGTTNVCKAIDYLSEKLDTSVPTIIITTTDGAFNDHVLAKTKWNDLMNSPYVMGGCIAMGKSADSRGASSMNRGECLVEGSFSTTDGCDNVIQLVPNFLIDLSRLCFMGEERKNIPLFVKLTCKDGSIDDIFGNVLFPSKSYDKLLAVVEYNATDEKKLPTIALTDNTDNEILFDLNLIAPNSRVGIPLNIIVKTKHLKWNDPSQLSSLRGTIVRTIESINSLKFEKESLEMQLESLEKGMSEPVQTNVQEDTESNVENPGSLDTRTPSDDILLNFTDDNGLLIQRAESDVVSEEQHLLNQLVGNDQTTYLTERIEELKKLILERQTIVDQKMVERRKLLVQSFPNAKLCYHKLKQMENDLEKFESQSEEEDFLVRLGKLAISSKKEELKQNLIALFGENHQNCSRFESGMTRMTSTAVALTSSEIYVTPSCVPEENYQPQRRYRTLKSPLTRHTRTSGLEFLSAPVSGPRSRLVGRQPSMHGSEFFSAPFPSHVQRTDPYDGDEPEDEPEDDNEMYEFPKCSICMDANATLLSHKCGHIISCNNHDTGCMNFFELLQREDQKCPFCRKELDENVPAVPITVTEDGTKCQRCVQKKIKKDDSFATSVLECGHLGFCTDCKQQCDRVANENNSEPQRTSMYSCYQCGTKQKVLCQVYF